MAGYLNKVTLIGNLGRDPEVRFMQDGNKVVSFTLATTEYWKDKATNERRDRTEWHRIVVFNERLGEICEQYLRKGKKVYLEGQLQTRKWTDNNGQERTTTEIVLQRFRGEIMMLDSRNDNAAGVGHEGGEQGRSAESFPPFNESLSDELNDEIPF